MRATAVDGVQNGYRVAIVREAVGDRWKPAHDQALFDLDAKYGDVVSTDATIAYLQGLKADPSTGQHRTA